MLLNAFSRMSKCLFHNTEPDAYWINIPNYVHILTTVIVIFFFKIPSRNKKITSITASTVVASADIINE